LRSRILPWATYGATACCACSRPKRCVRRFSKRPRRRILRRRRPARGIPELDCQWARTLDRARKKCPAVTRAVGRRRPPCCWLSSYRSFGRNRSRLVCLRPYLARYVICQISLRHLSRECTRAASHRQTVVACCNWLPQQQRRSGCRAVRGANPDFQATRLPSVWPVDRRRMTLSCCGRVLRRNRSLGRT